MVEILWVMAVAIGPAILAAAVVYAVVQTRHVILREKRTNHHAPEGLYEKRM